MEKRIEYLTRILESGNADLFELLSQHPDLDPSQRVALVLQDQSRRLQTDNPLSVEDYLERLPELSDDENAKVQLAINEYATRISNGAQTSLDDYTSRFGDIAESLRDESRLVEYATFQGEENEQQFIGRYRLTRLLGRGAFGLVWLAFDTELHRQVAIKVPSASCFKRAGDAESFLREARTVAKLDHPNIVPVHDVGRTEDGSVYIVSKFIEGGTLADRVRQGKLPPAQSAKLIATCALALAHAHEKRLIHRDIKPANILIDSQTNDPYVADFGLAIGQEEYLQKRRSAGTPAYMSPEQARGEGHRLDGRSDIFSLGVVLYELLTNKMPFGGSSVSDLFQNIITAEPRNPRKIENSIPPELERICLRALSKQASARYATATDFAEDLLNWDQQDPSTPNQLAIVPKGLRSFDADDADSFLTLLPGPRNRLGLPESIHFWKSRIEETDADQAFDVGLIYGPSGCGKSSLMKAGLLPRLDRSIVAVYLEATPEDTETRMLAGLRKQLPELPDDLKIAETFLWLRVHCQRKVIVVIDQFEQWLHSQRAKNDNELVRAMRQCDGATVQALVMVRDDFAMAAARFMNAIEVPIVQGHNFATVDLFDMKHARDVLIKFGQAFERLPPDVADINEQQREFIDRITEGLADDGKVVSVRLALFAEMVRGKPWIPETLHDVGGTQGLGAHFLDETFVARTANPMHRLHQNAARGVLMSLLPETGTDIKGHMRSHDDLMMESGYADRPSEFRELIRILDGELRLITPTDPANVDLTPEKKVEETQFYQLTHDYLVPSLREWLTKKQKETRRGRVELVLEERSSLWNEKKTNRQLPSIGEWARIHRFTDSARWSSTQKQMMKSAGRYHRTRLAFLAACSAVMLGLIIFVRGRISESNSDQRASGFVTALVNADIEQVPRIINEMRPLERWTQPRLMDAFGTLPNQSNEKLNVALALLSTDRTKTSSLDRSQIQHDAPEILDYLQDRLIGAEPQQTSTMISLLRPYGDVLTPALWESVQERQSGEILASASALAVFDPQQHERWNSVSPKIADALVKENTLRVAIWISTLHPARRHLIDPLGDVFRADPTSRSQKEINLATEVLENFAVDDLDALTGLLLDASPRQFTSIFDEFAAHGEKAMARLRQVLDRPLAAKSTVPESDTAPDAGPPVDNTMLAERAEADALRTTNAATAALLMGDPEQVWTRLRFTPDSLVRAWLVERLAQMGVSLPQVAGRLDVETDVSIRRAQVLSLGQFPAPDDRSISTQLLDLYFHDGDAGIHSAARWTLLQWGLDAEVDQADELLGSILPDSAKTQTANWYVTPQGHCLSIISMPDRPRSQIGSPEIGSPEIDIANRGNGLHQEAAMERSFAIAVEEVSVEQFQAFAKANELSPFYKDMFSPEPDCPQTSVSWFRAAMYCRWLSELENIPEDQMCFPPIDQIVSGMELPSDYLTRTGYRLPTGAEWEYACRAGTTTSRYYGDSDRLLDRYAWFIESSSDHSWPGGKLKPNEFGLFDTLGNVWEWCFDLKPPSSNEADGRSQADNPLLIDGRLRMYRGAAFNSRKDGVRSDHRGELPPTNAGNAGGFRLARTHFVAPPQAKP